MRRPADQRSKDVLLALSVAGDFRQTLNRLQLQKLVYLFDVLALSWRHVGSPRGFRPWHNGPYDAAVQNAVDALAFRGFVAATDVAFRRTRNAEARYSLTEAGAQAVDRLAENAAIANDLQLLRAIGAEIDHRGWKKIKEIVYSEPTYNRARAKSEMSELPVNNVLENLSSRLLSDLKRAFDMDSAEPMSAGTLVQALFAILDQYRAQEDRTVSKTA